MEISPVMTLLGTTLSLLVLCQGGQIGGIELEAGSPIRGLSRFNEYGPGYFRTGEQTSGYVDTYRNAGRSGKRNRGPLVVGRYGRRRNRITSITNNTTIYDYQNSKTPGSNGAASNIGGIIKWENITARFAWRRKRQTVGKSLIQKL